MGLGQTLLTIMALMLMSRLILTVNRTMLEVDSSKDVSEYRITATSLGTSVLEYASDLSFDEATVDTTLTSSQLSSLTAPGFFGPDLPVETNPSLYDDIDDYQGYTRIDTIPNSAIFFTTIRVHYLNVVPPSTITVTTAKTFNKRLTVFVTSSSMVDYTMIDTVVGGQPKFRQDTLKFQSVFSYWYFR